MSETLQFGHSMVPPHCLQNTAVASPRRFSRMSDCCPASSLFVWRSSTIRWNHVGTVLGVLLAHVDDRYRTRGAILHAPISHRRVYRAVAAFWLLSSDGVAEPKHDDARPLVARAHDCHVSPMVARRLLCLNEVSCSSSTMMSPSLSSGATRPSACRRRPETSPADAVPLIGALAVGQAAVLNCHAIAECVAKR